eukprot:m.703819 g.703819  ORF g.703819 m.703819 type:complete len:68 (-) comp22918_c0_seq76:142-345(-)
MFCFGVWDESDLMCSVLGVIQAQPLQHGGYLKKQDSTLEHEDIVKVKHRTLACRKASHRWWLLFHKY